MIPLLAAAEAAEAKAEAERLAAEAAEAAEAERLAAEEQRASFIAAKEKWDAADKKAAEQLAAADEEEEAKIFKEKVAEAVENARTLNDGERFEAISQAAKAYSRRIMARMAMKERRSRSESIEVMGEAWSDKFLEAALQSLKQLSPVAKSGETKSASGEQFREAANRVLIMNKLKLISKLERTVDLDKLQEAVLEEMKEKKETDATAIEEEVSRRLANTPELQDEMLTKSVIAVLGDEAYLGDDGATDQKRAYSQQFSDLMEVGRQQLEDIQKTLTKSVMSAYYGVYGDQEKLGEMFEEGVATAMGDLADLKMEDEDVKALVNEEKEKIAKQVRDRVGSGKTLTDLLNYLDKRESELVQKTIDSLAAVQEKDAEERSKEQDELNNADIV